MFDQILDFLSGRWFWIPVLFFFGIFLIYLGKKRLRFETQPDPRYDLIPDEDVKKFWRWMSMFDIYRSQFYIYFFGPLVIVFSIINGIMLLLFNANMFGDLITTRTILFFCYTMLTSYAVSEGAALGRHCGSSVIGNKSEIIHIRDCGYQARQ